MITALRRRPAPPVNADDLDVRAAMTAAEPDIAVAEKQIQVNAARRVELQAEHGAVLAQLAAAPSDAANAANAATWAALGPLAANAGDTSDIGTAATVTALRAREGEIAAELSGIEKADRLLRDHLRVLRMKASAVVCRDLRGSYETGVAGDVAKAAVQLWHALARHADYIDRFDAAGGSAAGLDVVSATSMNNPARNGVDSLLRDLVRRGLVARDDVPGLSR